MLFKEPIPYDFVMVVWDDAEAAHGWEDESEITDIPAIVITAGFLVKDTKAAYTVASTISRGEEGMIQTNSRIRIPKGMVMEYRVLQAKSE